MAIPTLEFSFSRQQSCPQLYSKNHLHSAEKSLELCRSDKRLKNVCRPLDFACSTEAANWKRIYNIVYLVSLLKCWFCFARETNIWRLVRTVHLLAYSNYVTNASWAQTTLLTKKFCAFQSRTCFSSCSPRSIALINSWSKFKDFFFSGVCQPAYRGSLVWRLIII